MFGLFDLAKKKSADLIEKGQTHIKNQGAGLIKHGIAQASSTAGANVPVTASHTPDFGTATIDTDQVAGAPNEAVTTTKEDVKCGEMRRMFQDVVSSAFTDDKTTENEMLVELINKMILTNNSKLVNIIASTLPINSSSMKIRFKKNLTGKFKRNRLIWGGKRTQQKRQRKQGTKRRK